MSKTKVPEQFDKHDGFLTWIDDEGRNRCLGYLFANETKVYDAEYGPVNVTKEEAEAHNRTYDKLNIAGLDNCEIGQGGLFYLRFDDNGGITAHTWLGTELGPVKKVASRPSQYVLERNGRLYYGRLASKSEAIFLTRRT